MKKNFCPKCGKTTFRIPRLCKSCSLIQRWNKPGGLWRDKKWLKKQYFDNQLTFAKIAKIAGCTDKTVYHFFKKFGLTSRPTILGLKGKDNPRWLGGRVNDDYGYIRIYHPKPHAYQQNKRYVLEHILVMEKILGRPLKHPEMVHHKNGIQNDNHPKNLQLMANPTEHNTYEQLLGKFAKLVIFGESAPHLKSKLQLIFRNFISSSSVKER